MTHSHSRWTVGLALLVAGAVTATTFAQTRRLSRVEAFATDTWTFWVSRGENRVVVNGDGDTDLDCYVFEKRSGRLLGKDDDRTDYCIVDFTTYRGGEIEVRIENLGDVWNRYELTVH